jgi:hypothetical protein
MRIENFTHFLGKNVKTIEFGDQIVPNRVQGDNKIGYFFFEEPFIYFNNSINHLYFLVDDQDIIIEIYIYLNVLIDKKFYQTFIKLYGQATELLVNDGIIYDRKPVRIRNSTIKKTAYEVRNGKFEENPVFIKWNKAGYEVKIVMKYDKNVSEILFRRTE